MLQFQLIVIGRVEARADGALELVPEVYLRGPALAGPLPLIRGENGCPEAALAPEDRILAALEPTAGGWRWPGQSQAFVLRDGLARSGDGRTMAEDALVEALRRATGQLAYPAVQAEEGGFDWMGVGLPVGGALVAIFAVGLYLMRLWHRIDPT